MGDSTSGRSQPRFGPSGPAAPGDYRLPRDQIARCGHHYPRHPAYVAGDVSRSWGEMDARSDRIAAALQALGTRRGDAVGMLAGEFVEVYEHFFGCLKIGAIRVGINRRLAVREATLLGQGLLLDHIWQHHRRRDHCLSGAPYRAQWSGFSPAARTYRHQPVVLQCGIALPFPFANRNTSAAAIANLLQFATLHKKIRRKEIPRESCLIAASNAPISQKVPIAACHAPDPRQQ